MHEKRYQTILLPNGAMNLTRGCLHGCIYCDSRSKCYQMNHDFTDIELKTDAALILDHQLSRKRKKIMIKTGAMSDPYMNDLDVLNQTRKCFEVIKKHRFGLTFQTKSTLFLKDLDLLKAIHQQSKLIVQMTITTFNDDLALKLEPNVSKTSDRIKALSILKEHQIPSIVWISPLLPWINDDLDNLRRILEACKEAEVLGIIWFGASMTLREGNREYFYHQLDRLFPGLKNRYINQYRDSYVIHSSNHQQLNDYLEMFCKKHHMMYNHSEIFNYINDMSQEKTSQLSLF